jgi:hypothetical protein
MRECNQADRIDVSKIIKRSITPRAQSGEPRPTAIRMRKAFDQTLVEASGIRAISSLCSFATEMKFSSRTISGFSVPIR